MWLPDRSTPLHHRSSGSITVNANPQPTKRGALNDTPLDVLRKSFDALAAEPCRLALPGEALGHGLPERDIYLGELKELLMSRDTSADAKHAIWAAVIDLSREGHAAWTVAACGLAYPGLAGFALRICLNSPGNLYDIQAELLTEFLAALKVVDVDDPDITDIAGWLCFRALNASYRARESEPTSGVLTDNPPDSTVPLIPVAHPDLILSWAVQMDILSATEAEMIGRLYLDGEHFSVVAADLALGTWTTRGGKGVSTATLYRYRKTAVDRLLAAIESGTLRTR